MKKIIIVLCLAFITFINFQKVYAREFLEEQDNNYLRHINIEDKDDIAGESIRKLFNKITDEDGNIYFDISSYYQFVLGRDYNKTNPSINSKQLEYISKIIYFGMNYRTLDESFYFFTQYFIDLFLIGNDVYYMGDHILASKNINMIKNDIENIKFSLTDFMINNNEYIINDKYIIDNFIIEEDNLIVTYKDDKIIINFLNNLENYSLHFIPKNNCQNIYTWTAEKIELLNINHVCEQDYIINVKNLAYKDENNIDMEPIDKNKPTDNEEIIEVAVPNTNKYNYSFFIILLILGNIYYVFKK